MALDVEKVREQAARIAGEAAEAINDVAEHAQPLASKASVTFDGLVEKGRPYVERAERAVQDAVDGVRGHKSGGGGGKTF